MAALLVAGAAVLAWRMLANRPAAAPVAVVRTAKAFVGPLDVTLRMTGQTSARNFVNVTAPTIRGPEARGNMILLQLVNGGSLVKKGDLLASIDAQSMQDHVDDLKDTIHQASNDIEKRKAEQAVDWERLQQTLRVTKSSWDKAKLDYQTAEVKTDIERQLLKLSVDEAEARYKQQAASLADRKASNAAEMKILQITAERHRRHMERHIHDVSAYTIHAPMSGLVVMGTTWRGGDMGQFQQGDPVMPGMPLLKVVDPTSMQVEGTVSQSDSGLLRIGQTAKIGLDAFKDLAFSGKVYSVGALASGGWRQSTYVRTIPVRVLIEGSDPKLIPDLSAHCDIVLETLPNQLQIPLAAVKEHDGKATVMVRSADGWSERAVSLGKRSNVNVAIVGGLNAGDEVRVQF